MVKSNTTNTSISIIKTKPSINRDFLDKEIKYCAPQAYLFFGLFMSIPILLSILFSTRLCYITEKVSSPRTRVATFLLAIMGLYPQYWACRFREILCSVDLTLKEQ